MEKFARNALIEGVADVRHLTVGRESELFRALNMHYNKANDFQVSPACTTDRDYYGFIIYDPIWPAVICQFLFTSF